MKSFRPKVSLLCTLLGTLWVSIIAAEPVQYCKSGSPYAQNEEIDFCVGALLHQNSSSNAHDLYLTIKIPKPQNSALGWTAIGLGAMMEGSLMFIVYGDPLGHEGPIVSIRTATGHHQPTLLGRENLPEGMDLRVIRSSWLSFDSNEKQDLDNPSYEAWVSLVCYSCYLWHGTKISAEARSQPWMWAWNAEQKFDVFSYDAHLSMHKHHAGAGGWGNFYVDMSSSISTAKWPPSLPPITPDITNFGASAMQMSFSGSITDIFSGPGSYAHGFILASAFLIFFPASVVALRSRLSKSFKYHWVIQGVASLLLISGVILGLLKSRRLDTVHQWAGITLASCVGFQALFGWWHHRRFVKLQRRAWVSFLHIWLGRSMMVIGWANVVSGLSLRGYKSTSGSMLTVIIVVCLEAVGFAVWTFWRQRKWDELVREPSWADIDDERFALALSDDEDEVDEMDEASLMY
ncbi:CBD9-like protein [Mollisia scopiformis]|uniref:CBD9-like protein n=1 Tax=Mollisia scopiformis TaxID=149040 RepID=A0A194XHX8_MOLSC|nr:CBD9-like protein [Mollisia scopiformis]KUJ19763.1 CBD9-like protein [Mollisia scopiformis]